MGCQETFPRYVHLYQSLYFLAFSCWMQPEVKAGKLFCRNRVLCWSANQLCMELPIFDAALMKPKANSRRKADLTWRVFKTHLKV